MNFIAHLFLSGNEEGLIVGNYIGDAIKGRMYLDYKKDIQDGILLHRQIDKFTDEHPSGKEVRRLFIPQYHKYAGVVVDLVYDYFLCKNWNKYSPDLSLQKFIDNSHAVLHRNLELMPASMQRFFKMMIANNSLLSYSNIKGLKKTLDNMSKFKNLPDASDFAIKTLYENEDFIDEKFIVFFDDIQLFTKVIIKKL